MLFKPKWVKLLPAHLRPDQERVKQLDALRTKYGIPHDALALRILSSRATTRKAQRHCLEQCTAANRGASEKELLRMVLVSRLMAPPVTPMTPEEVDAVMENINTLDDLCEYIIAEDERSPMVGADVFGLGERIDDILAERKTESRLLFAWRLLFSWRLLFASLVFLGGSVAIKRNWGAALALAAMAFWLTLLIVRPAKR